MAAPDYAFTLHAGKTVTLFLTGGHEVTGTLNAEAWTKNALLELETNVGAIIYVGRGDVVAVRAKKLSPTENSITFGDAQA